MNKLGKIKLDNIKLKNQIKGLTSNTIISADENTILKASSLGNISVEDRYKINQTSISEISLVDDKILKGGYRVVATIQDRDNILCCYRKTGMKVVVVGQDFSFIEYILKSEDPCENIWEEVIVNVDIDESEVSLVEDYSELGQDIESQMQLNIVLKNLLIQLQSDIQNVEAPTKTSQLQNDGEDGSHPFITAEDIPAVIQQVNSDWNSTEGPSQILNKPVIPTNTSDLFNDGDGLTPFITSADVEIQSDIISDVSEGNITAGQVIPQGTSLTEFVELFLIKIFNPTFTNPSFSLSSNAGTREIGETFNLNLTTNFLRGSINGNTVSGIWNPSAFQNPLTGVATETTIDGTVGTSLTYSNYKTLASQSFSAIVKYASGAQPKNSKGGDFSSPYPSGQLNASTQFNGGLRRFAGQTSTVPTTGEQIRSMLITSSVLNTGNSFTITANGIDKNFVIAVPSTKTMVKVMTSNNENVTSNFNLSLITTVPDAGGDPQSYNVYTMSTVGVFSAGLVLTVTLK